MKYSIFLFCIFFTLNACGQNDKKYEEINFLNQFYKNYVKNWENEKELDLLKNKSLSIELINKITFLNTNGELNYDPLINAQDINDDILKNLKISPLKENGSYKVCYSSSYEKDSICITLQIIKSNNSYLINDIKVNDIQSILKLKINTVKDVDYADNDDFHMEIHNQDIVVFSKGEKEIYKNLFINEMSISTTIEKERNNEFSLVYESNASVTKIKEKYKFQYLDDGLHLIFKETVKFGQEGLAINKIYFNNYSVQGQTYESIQKLGDKLNFVFENKTPVSYLYDYNSNIFGNVSYDFSTEEFFILYPEINNGKFIISNIEKANNLAHSLEEHNILNESVFLLYQIILQYPDRVVAYLNLADAYWGLGNEDEAKKHYEKYISLMKSQGKDLKKIPQRVYDRTK